MSPQTEEIGFEVREGDEQREQNLILEGAGTGFCSGVGEGSGVIEEESVTPQRVLRHRRWQVFSGLEILHFEQNSSSRLVSKFIYQTVSDTKINCNRRFWASLDIGEPIKLWELGITCCRDEEQVISELERMEDRDQEGKIRSVDGNQNCVL